MAKKSTRRVATPVRTAPAQVKIPPAPALGRGAEAWLPWLLAAVAFALFSTGFGNQMVSMDDHTATVNNEAVKNLSFFRAFNLGMYAPVTWAGYGLAYALGQAEPFWYHFLSALVHALNTFLAFRLLRRLDALVEVAALAALFFAIHPIQVEAVAWIAGFSTPLFSLFYLLALDFYVRHTRTGSYGKHYYLALLMFLVACLAKSAAVTLPLTLLVLDLWLQRGFNTRRWLEKAPFFAISLVFGLLTLYSRGQSGHTVSPLGGDFSVVDRFFMACHTVLFYWAKLLAPTGLSIWYPFEKTGGAWPWTYYAAPVALGAIIALAWRFRANLPLVWAGLLFYFSNIILSLPYYTIGTFELRSDRYNYLACLGIFVMLAALPAFTRNRRPAWTPAAWALLGVLTLFWLYASILRIRDWRDSITLMTRAIAATGDNFGRAYLWRGMHYGDKGKGSEALADLSRAIERNPALTEAYKYRGGLFGMAKQYDKSVADLSVYLEKNPRDYEMVYNRGLSYLNLGRPQEALADFNKTLEINPNFDRAYRTRSQAWMALGEKEKADADMREWEKRKGQ
jgi:tetratricopeptide (TPR) repeat protein